MSLPQANMRESRLPFCHRVCAAEYMSTFKRFGQFAISDVYHHFYRLGGTFIYGLNHCWIGGFNNEDVAQMLMLPREYDVVALITLVYPCKKIDSLATILHVVRPRKKMEETVSPETYGGGIH